LTNAVDALNQRLKQHREPSFKAVIVCIVVLCSSVSGVEWFLRWQFGFGNPPLVYLNDSYGYAFRPSQDLRRFGKRVYYSKEGLRSEELREGAVKVLCVGDSVTNGGMTTDQAETYPYRLEDRLRSKGLNAQVLNLSAGGWAIGNELEFLKSHGIFGARAVILEVGSDDFSQKTSTSASVAGNPSFPTHAPPSAIYELLVRYLNPRLRRAMGTSKVASDPHSEGDPAECRRLLGEMIRYVLTQGAHPVVMVMPNTTEVATGKYVQDHLGAVSELCRPTDCEPVDAMRDLHAAFEAGPKPFRDAVHPNEAGNQIMAKVVWQAVMRALSGTPSI
jgi:lysophospholipase L1-like esterase